MWSFSKNPKTYPFKRLTNNNTQTKRQPFFRVLKNSVFKIFLIQLLIFRKKLMRLIQFNPALSKAALTPTTLKKN